MSSIKISIANEYFFFSVLILILTDVVGLTSNDNFKNVHAIVCHDLMDKMKSLFVLTVFISSINQSFIIHSSNPYKCQ